MKQGLLFMKIIFITLLMGLSINLFARTTSDNHPSCVKEDLTQANSGLMDIVNIGEKLSEEDIVIKLCIQYSMARRKNKDPIDEVKYFILEQEGLPKDTEKWEEVVIKFLNKFGEKLVCPKSDTTALYDNEHFYKRAISSWKLEIFEDLLLDNEYPVELNMIQMRDGKPETLLDFIEKVIEKGVSSELKGELNILKRDLRELGAKYAREL